MATDLQIAIRKITSVNPATGEVMREFEPAAEAEVIAAVARARTAQLAWHGLGVQQRIHVLDRFRELLHDQKSEVARLITHEAGKPQVEALLTEVMVVLDAARFYSENSYAFLRDQALPHANLAMKTKSGRLAREPYGVIGIISPWNYPFSIPATETLAALVAGNAVVLKPSEFTSLIALELAAFLWKAGVPKDVLQVVVGDGSTGNALVNANIDKLVFTGSVATGKRIAQTAAARLLPVVLELGGKDPMLVFADADLDVASSGAVWGAFMNAGQACLSVERCYVHRSLYQPFLEACARKAAQLRVGNGMDPQTDVGPLINERQVRNVEAHVEDARLHGARMLAGGVRRTDLGPNFYAPTVLADVTHQMRIMREETFGPVLPIMPFETDDEAVRLANDSDFGLGASIWIRNRVRGEALARRIQAGTVMINDAVSCFGVSEAPHGGVKASGIGRTHGIFGLEEMVRIKYIDSDRLPGMKKVWWYEYGPGFTRQIEGFLDLMFAKSWGKRLQGALRSAGVLTRKGKI
ncbi:NAD/NADP-dependent betaine aldehyde dehydrogenase [Candidatus Sulfotelmatobacter sp. SbA7]|jgi:acyl-CoA reductase-like NAD-dependent aldehyde dehydrogenase|nr:NAD/NADP-dependent betaine aldehyde dehydrogenase [Candidatus Sulfotelmatobacter sp. SbA7]